MAQAQGVLNTLAYVAESTFGTTPDTPALIETRVVSHSLAVNREFVTSPHIGKRGEFDGNQGVGAVGGDIQAMLRYGEFDTFLEAVMQGTWTTNVLKIGTTKRSFTFEDPSPDLTTATYAAYRGVMLNTLAINLTPGAVHVPVTFGVVGKSLAYADSPLDASYTAPSNNAAFTAFEGSISEGGSAIATVTALTLNLNNNLAPANALFDNEPVYINNGVAQVSGEMTVLFTAKALANKFLNETETTLSFTIESAAGDLTFLCPRVKYTGAAVPNGLDARVMTLPFTALYDTTEATALKITRAAA